MGSFYAAPLKNEEGILNKDGRSSSWVIIIDATVYQ